jgi:chromosome segregation ATPase
MADSEKITTLRNACQSMSGHRRVLEAQLAVMKAAEELAADDQLVRDLEQRRDIARRDADQQHDRLKEIEKKLELAKLNVKSQEAAAAKVIVEAEKRAAEIKQLAKDEGAKLTGAAVTKKQSLELESKKLQDELDEMNATVAKRRAELIEIEQKIADTKAEALKRFA